MLIATSRAGSSQQRGWLRADRLATLYLFHPLQECLGLRRPPRVPILMYHSVSELNSKGAHPYFETATSPGVFAGQMKCLRESGYRTLGLSDAVKSLTKGAELSDRSVVLTFDDGFQDFLTNAFPILHKYGFTANVFLPTGYIGHERRQFAERDCLTWTEVRELHQVGVTFGSHTVSHPQLKSLSAREVEAEIRDSKDIIEYELGIPVDSFSYPFAFPETNRAFKRALREVLAAEGYMTGVSTIIGTASAGNDEYFLPRLPVNSWDDLRLFRAKLEGGYDWLHPLQYAAKLRLLGGS